MAVHRRRCRDCVAIGMVVIGGMMSGCASDPSWLSETVEQPFYRHARPDSQVTRQAAADAEHVRHIERAALRTYDQAENPDLPHWQIEKLVWALWWNSHDEAYVELATRLAAADPDHYGGLLALLVGQKPIEQCEAELLPIAFRVLPADACEPARRGRAFAARLLVQKCALDAREVPRPLPAGVRTPLVPDSGDRACHADQLALVAVYSGYDAASLEELERRAREVSEDHDRAELETIVARLRAD